ncbi:class I SAM-dependent methyltransferase [Nonomuraea sp. NPDC049504]|uniref:class I SAM-dependent methyltransferase n=1 Tax=Nonomuraea sp. NPDC049504 TaxID=3154729 RepID=UPI0034488A85
MGFDHNEHYHELLIRGIPEGAKQALDVGCGTGAFARRLAGRGLVTSRSRR